jgi:hypothetical protein
MVAVALGACSANPSGGNDAAPIDATALVDAKSIDAGISWQPTWIDVHTHCGNDSAKPCVDGVFWSNARNNEGAAVLLGLEHFAVAAENGDIPVNAPELRALTNARYMEAAAADPSIIFFASLPCWHDTLFTEADWSQACKENVDEWLALGAKGFKDHIGKQFDHAGNNDVTRFLGGWNRLNGFCTSSSSEPNKDCMSSVSVRYPALEAKWREVVRYIVEDKQVPLITHANSWSGTEQCYDLNLGSVDGCGPVTTRALHDFASWAAATLSEEARKRIIVAHGAHSATNALPVLEAGLSIDLAADFLRSALADDACAARSLLSTYPTQVLLGSDHNLDQACLATSYAALDHMVEATPDNRQSFDTCLDGTIVAGGAALGSPTLSGCPDIPANTLSNLRRNNFLRLYAADPPWSGLSATTP